MCVFQTSLFHLICEQIISWSHFFYLFLHFFCLFLYFWRLFSFCFFNRIMHYSFLCRLSFSNWTWFIFSFFCPLIDISFFLFVSAIFMRSLFFLCELFWWGLPFFMVFFTFLPIFLVPSFMFFTILRTHETILAGDLNIFWFWNCPKLVPFLCCSDWTSLS